MPFAVAVAVIMLTSVASTCHLNRVLERGFASLDRALERGFASVNQRLDCLDAEFTLTPNSAAADARD